MKCVKPQSTTTIINNNTVETIIYTYYDEHSYFFTMSGTLQEYI